MKKLFSLFAILVSIDITAQNVGIGTVTPVAKLHIVSTNSEVIRLDAPNPYLSLYSSGSFKGFLWKGPGSIDLGSVSGSNLGITISPEEVTRMLIGSNGKVGIGSTNPSRNLDISAIDTTRLLIASYSGFGAAGIEFGSDYGLANYWRPGYIITADSGNFTGRLDFYTNGTGGTEKLSSIHGMSILNGKVGIGTKYPYTPLHVEGASILDGWTYMASDASIGGNVSVLGKSYLADSVKIGTGGTYTAPLSINSNSFLGGPMIDLAYSSENNRLGIGYINNFLPPSHQAFTFSVSQPQDEFAFGVGSSLSMAEVLNIKGTGYIGISNNSPHAPLQFANTTLNRKIVLWELANNDHQYYGFGVNGGILRYQTATNADDHVFYAATGTTSSTELFRIKGDGNIGVGVSNPVFRLDVGDRMRIRSGTNSAGVWFNNDANTTSPAFIGMKANDEVGFYGQTGSANWRFYINTTTGNGWMQGVLTQNSDMRLKRNITPLQNSLQKIMQLGGYHYFWKDQNNDNSLQTGVLAQEVQKLFPELVTENKDGILAVNYSGLIPVMIESIKEQQQTIERQQKQIDDLKKMFERFLKQ